MRHQRAHVRCARRTADDASPRHKKVEFGRQLCQPAAEDELGGQRASERAYVLMSTRLRTDELIVLTLRRVRRGTADPPDVVVVDPR